MPWISSSKLQMEYGIPALRESESHKMQDFGSLLFKKTPPEA